jgi:hypothetical protein
VHLKRTDEAGTWTGARVFNGHSEHLRIRDVGIDPDFEHDNDHTRLEAVPSAVTLKAPPAANIDASESYSRSLKNIDTLVYSIAAAVTALDSIESKLVQARAQIETLRMRGEPVNHRKVEVTLGNLADHLNAAISRVDVHTVNLMRDTRIEVRIKELDSETDREMGLNLTVISLEKLLTYKLREDADTNALCELIDTMSSVVHNNLHILTSLVLVLFASRDYTHDVAAMVLPQGFDGGSVEHDSRVRSIGAPPNLLGREDREAIAIRAAAARSDASDAGTRARTSLMALLDRMRQQPSA